MLAPSQVIVLAVPVFLLLMAAEWAVARARGLAAPRLNDTLASLSAGLLSQLAALFTSALTIGLYTLAFDRLALWRADAFWTSPAGWLLALLAYDVCYYWLHRGGHRVAILWAAHVVHHQSQAYNLSTALRQTSTGALLGWLFYLPMALAGVPPLVFAVVALVDLLYQFWVHTELVGRLGWFDRWLCSPSNHRVHHAVEDRFLDRNYGGILMLWDRLFGTFQDEDGPCTYGTRAPLDSWDPLWANLQVYAQLAHDSWHARRWRDKLQVWVRPPGWRPADVAQRFPRPGFDLARVRRFDPPLTPRLQAAGAVWFALLLAAALGLLWQAPVLPLLQSLLWAGAVVAGLWALGAVMQGRLPLVDGLALQAMAVATAASAGGLWLAYAVAKPAALALLMVALAPQLHRPGGRWLLAGLGFSLAGDVLLLWRGLFIAGLVAFLTAHLCYIVLLRRGVGWLPRPAALAGTLALGAIVYAVLLPGLNPVLRIAVAGYVAVIATMAAQAIGRALVRRDAAAWRVAGGSALFMASDTLLALDKFHAPLPLAPLWVLGTYYGAQWLIARHALAPADLPGIGASEPRGSSAVAGPERAQDVQLDHATPAGAQQGIEALQVDRRQCSGGAADVQDAPDVVHGCPETAGLGPGGRINTQI